MFLNVMGNILLLFILQGHGHDFGQEIFLSILMFSMLREAFLMGNQHLSVIRSVINELQI